MLVLTLFNLADEKIDIYGIQIAPLPENPIVNEKSQILFRVENNDFRYLNDHFDNH